MKTASLDRLLRFLDAQDARSLAGTAVEQFLSQYQIDPDEFLNFVFFREDRYARNLVHRTEHCELLILTWLPGQFTPVHDHGGKRCWISVHTGTLTFKTFGPITDENQLPPQRGSEEWLAEDAPLYLDDGIGIHSITNATRKPAISLHLYAGPIRRCRIYDEKLGCFRWKDLQYFTKYGKESRSPVLDLT